MHVGAAVGPDHNPAIPFADGAEWDRVGLSALSAGCREKDERHLAELAGDATAVDE
jgi:hypothetical protein